MVSSFSNLDIPGPDEGYPSSQQFSGTNYESYNGGDLFSGNNSGNDSDNEAKTKNEHFLNSEVVLQQKNAFESFVRSVYKDSKDMNRYFEVVKSSLGTKLEQVLSPETMLEYFDRISQKPFSRIANTTKSRWTDDEVLLLTHIVIYYSYANATEFETLPEEAWTYIASIFPNKEVSQLKKRWQGCLKKTLWQVPWTQQEDELLEKIINDKGHTRKWKEIAEELNARSDLEVYRHGRQCRERWNNHLDPNISRGPFTEEEDIRLFQIFRETGKKWAEISKKMKNRTENAVKNRFNSLMKKLKSRQNTALSENQSIMSIESEPDNAKLEKRLVDQFLQQYEAGGIGSKARLDKTRTSLLSKSEIPDHDEHSESLFESDSESYSQNPKSLNYLDIALSKKAGIEKDKTKSMGELNDGFRAFPSSNLQMEEEFPVNQGHSHSNKPAKFDQSFSTHIEKLDLLSNPNLAYQNALNYQFSQNNILNKTNSIFPESPARGRSNSVPYQPSSQHPQDLLTNSLFGNNTNLDNLNPSMNSLQKNGGKYQPSSTGYKPTSNPILANSNPDQGARADSIINSLNNLTQFLECEGSNGSSPLRQNRFPFENYDAKGPTFAQTKLEEDDMNEISPTKRIGEFSHQLKTKKLDKYQAQRQIGRANLQYAIVDLTKNEIYMVHPVTRENFSGTISKMNGEDSLLASPFNNPSNLLGSEFLTLGKSGEQSPSIGYLQSLIGKPSLQIEANPNIGLPSLFSTTADYNEKNKPNSMTLVEQHFQNIRKKFGVPDNSENQFKSKGNN